MNQATTFWTDAQWADIVLKARQFRQLAAHQRQIKARRIGVGGTAAAMARVLHQIHSYAAQAENPTQPASRITLASPTGCVRCAYGGMRLEPGSRLVVCANCNEVNGFSS